MPTPAIASAEPGAGRPSTRPPRSGARARLAAGLVALLAGCASPVPEAVRLAPAPAIGVAEVQRDPGCCMGRTVRWGGTIVSVTNRAHSTEIEILARPLDGDGEPRPGAPGEGRFLAEAQGFLDPAEYPNDRSLTIAGPLLRVETRQVGEYPYVYPVVRADSRWLWPESPPPYLYPGYGPWPWGGPWYDPWRWPFYGPPYGIYARPWSY